jgi:hypothetical protein
MSGLCLNGAVERNLAGGTKRNRCGERRYGGRPWQRLRSSLAGEPPERVVMKIGGEKQMKLEEKRRPNCHCVKLAIFVLR